MHGVYFMGQLIPVYVGGIIVFSYNQGDYNHYEGGHATRIIVPQSVYGEYVSSYSCLMHT